MADYTIDYRGYTITVANHREWVAECQRPRKTIRAASLPEIRQAIDEEIDGPPRKSVYQQYTDFMRTGRW